MNIRLIFPAVAAIIFITVAALIIYYYGDNKPHINYRTTFLYGNDTLGYTQTNGIICLQHPSEGRKVNDSLYVIKFEKKDTIKPLRYFLISYTTMPKNSTYPIVGDDWFQCNYFPSKIEIDSLINEFLPLRKECYRGIVVTNIFEFKSAEDFDRFSYNHKPDTPVKKQQCADPEVVTTHIYH